MKPIYALAAGMLVVIVGVFLTRLVVDWVEKTVQEQYPSSEAVESRSKGGMLLGLFECTIFFLSFWLLGVALAATWLAFKTAAKWESRKSLPDNGKKSVADIAVRHRVFVVGTAANMIVGLIAAGVAFLLNGKVVT